MGQGEAPEIFGLDWSPKTDFSKLVQIMVDEDLKLAKQEKLLLEEGLLKPTWENFTI